MKRYRGHQPKLALADHGDADADGDSVAVELRVGVADAVHAGDATGRPHVGSRRSPGGTSDAWP